MHWGKGQNDATTMPNYDPSMEPPIMEFLEGQGARGLAINLAGLQILNLETLSFPKPRHRHETPVRTRATRIASALFPASDPFLSH